MSKVTASRANTLDSFLEELPDFTTTNGLYSYPSDDFFDGYLEALGQRTLQGNGSGEQQEPAPEPYNGVMGSSTNAASFNPYVHQPQQLSSMMPTAMSLELENQFSTFQPPPQQNGMSHLNGDAPAYNGTTYNPQANGGTAPIEMPLIGEHQNGNLNAGSENSNSGGWEPNNETPTERGGHRARALTDQHLDSGDSDEADHKRRGPGGKTRRNAKQQAQNKQAQQRYRERRKQRFSEMEHAIDELTTKLEHMTAIQSQNAMLKAKQNELEAMLNAKDQELDRLKSQGSGQDASENHEGLEQRKRAEESYVQEWQTKAAILVDELTKFMEFHGLKENPMGEGVDPQIVQTLAEMVGRCSSICQTAQRAEGIQVLKLISADVKDISRITCMRKCGRIQKILADLKLNDVQKEQLLQVRANHLQNLRATFERRHSLNLQAISVMLPSGSQGIQALDKQMQCISLCDYRGSAAKTVDLDDLLSSIKGNLREEQKYVMELNFVVMHRIFSPIQAALFLTGIHPAYCDALELANALHQQYDPQHSGELRARSPESHPSPTSSGDKLDTSTLQHH